MIFDPHLMKWIGNEDEFNDVFKNVTLSQEFELISGEYQK
jgi:hypothetical protein